MQISERRVGDVTILDLEGRLVYEDGFEPLRAKLSAVIGDGSLNVLLNLDRVTYLDSAGIGLIACKYVTLQRMGGTLKLCNLHDRSHKVLNVTKLLTVFESFRTEEEALKTFNASSAL